MTDVLTPTPDTSSAATIGRRGFLGATAGIAGALVLFNLEAGPLGSLSKATATTSLGDVPTPVSGWVGINADNTVTVAFGGAEMGQGVLTGLAQAVAEELMVDWSQVTTQVAPPANSYITGGSYGIRGNLLKMRVVGAQARDMLIAAAAAQWKITPSACTAASGVVTNTLTGETLKYVQLAAAAAQQPTPASPTLTDPTKFRIIRTRAKRIDIPSKVNGSAKFGIDTMVPGMVFAAIKQCPTIGGTLVGTPAVPAGAIAVVPLGNAVAVVASNTWAAMNAAANLQVSWKIPTTAAGLTTTKLVAAQAALMQNGTVSTPIAEQVADAPGAFTGSAVKVEQTYSVPYLPHVMMEVPNCTASVTATSAEVWAPTQAPSWVVGTVKAITGLDEAHITVHATLLGGGLGRKIEQDYIAQAVTVAKAIGKPVKLTWSREEDLGHDQYRPSGQVRVRIGLDNAHKVNSYAARIVTPSPLFQRGWMGPTGNDNVEGAKDLPYQFPNRLVEYVRDPAAVPVGFWRSVGNSINCFAVESAIDEAARAVGADPVAFRRELLGSDLRTIQVLNSAADQIGWTTPAPAGVGRGIAIGTGFGSLVALAIEVSQPVLGTLQVRRVACAVDVGLAVNPDQVEAQMQGGILHGLSAALWGQTTFSSGRASSRNFSNTRVVKMKETPLISVKIFESGAQFLGGVGEVAVPPVAPALANAYAALNGTRVRTLPFFPGATMGGG